jgi:hypothetical protein
VQRLQQAVECGAIGETGEAAEKTRRGNA